MRCGVYVTMAYFINSLSEPNLITTASPAPVDIDVDVVAVFIRSVVVVAARALPRLCCAFMCAVRAFACVIVAVLSNE